MMLGALSVRASALVIRIMLSRAPTFLTAILTMSLVAGCASVPRQGGFADVERVVGQRTGLRIQWDQGRPEDLAVKEQIQSLVQTPLTADAAVQLALLQNRSLQATFEELGIA